VKSVVGRNCFCIAAFYAACENAAVTRKAIGVASTVKAIDHLQQLLRSLCPAKLAALPDILKLQLSDRVEGICSALDAAIGVECVADKAADAAGAVKADGVTSSRQCLQSKNSLHSIILHVSIL
jgi:transcription initiation factor TFIIIB Brf1 subunit/transcription initiation factor TFIIB